MFETDPLFFDPSLQMAHSFAVAMQSPFNRQFDDGLIRQWSSEYLRLLESHLESHIAISRIKSTVAFGSSVVDDSWLLFESTESTNVFAKYADSVNPPHTPPKDDDDGDWESILDIGTRV